MCCFPPSDQKNIIVDSGQNVILPCRVPLTSFKPIITVVWKRADLGEECVFSYPNQRFHPENQHPSFKNRVDLQDRQMKGGDVSLILMDLTTDDAGAYECYLVQKGANHSKTMSLDGYYIRATYLTVSLQSELVEFSLLVEIKLLPGS